MKNIIPGEICLSCISFKSFHELNNNVLEKDVGECQHPNNKGNPAGIINENKNEYGNCVFMKFGKKMDF